MKLSTFQTCCIQTIKVVFFFFSIATLTGCDLFKNESDNTPDLTLKPSDCSITEKFSNGSCVELLVSDCSITEKFSDGSCIALQASDCSLTEKFTSGSCVELQANDCSASENFTDGSCIALQASDCSITEKFANGSCIALQASDCSITEKFANGSCLALQASDCSNTEKYVDGACMALQETDCSLTEKFDNGTCIPFQASDCSITEKFTNGNCMALKISDCSITEKFSNGSCIALQASDCNLTEKFDNGTCIPLQAIDCSNTEKFIDGSCVLLQESDCLTEEFFIGGACITHETSSIVETENYIVYLPQSMKELEFGQEWDCNAATFGELVISIKYTPTVKLCTKRERFNDIDFEPFSHIIGDESGIVSAVIVTDKNNNIIYHLLYGSEGNWSGCRTGESWPNGNPADRSQCEEPSVDNITLDITRSYFLLTVEGQPFELADFIMQPIETYPGGTIESLIELSSSKPSQALAFKLGAKAYNASNTYGANAVPASVENQALILALLTQWKTDEDISLSTYYSALGNMGSELTYPIAQPLIESADGASIQTGLKIVRLIESEQVRTWAINSFVSLHEGDIDSYEISMITRDVLEVLENPNDEEYNTLLSIHENSDITNSNLVNWLQEYCKESCL